MMMRMASVRNVCEAYRRLIFRLMQLRGRSDWRSVDSRAGAVLELRTPAVTIYERPWENVLFDGVRDANPFFHVMESLWILAGRRDVAWLAQFNRNMENFADDRGVLHGAYGYRLRFAGSNRAHDQIDSLLHYLRRHPNGRQGVLAMWDPQRDLNYDGAKDIPCNTHAYFKIHDGRLDMTVCCRSNDAIWGAYGANAVHFSYLQEYVAVCLGVEVGTYYHLSDSLHVYEDNPTFAYYEDIGAEPAAEITRREFVRSLRIYKEVIKTRVPLVKNPETFDSELPHFVDGLSSDYWAQQRYTEPFLRDVAVPMRLAWNARNGDHGETDRQIERIRDDAWRIACHEWIQRRRTDK